MAGQELLVRKSVTVYSDPNSNSTVVTTLEAGDRVPISGKEYGKFRKILVDAGGKKQVGYVLESQLDGNRVRESGDQKKKHQEGGAFHQKTSLGIPFVFSYARQGQWKFSDGSGSAVDISETSGVATFFGFSLDLPMDDDLALRIGLYFRKLSQTGNAKPTGGSDKKIEKTVNFFGGNLIAKYYPSESGDFWVGGGAELSRGNKVNLVYADSEVVEVNESDFPTFFIIKGSVGYDFSLFGDFYLIPELDIFSAVNVSPIVFGADVVFTTSYAF